MEATLEVREYEINDSRIDTRKTFFGGIKTVVVPLGLKKKYAVDLHLTPSEEEKAIILKYKLDELAIETEPKFTDEFLEAQLDSYRAMGMTEEQLNHGIRQGNDELRAMKTQTLLNQYFDNPFTKTFDIRQDAHTYADKLEKEILPMIKSQIDYYRLESVRLDKRTITL
jgi:hypothetical protein